MICSVLRIVVRFRGVLGTLPAMGRSRWTVCSNCGRIMCRREGYYSIQKSGDLVTIDRQPLCVCVQAVANCFGNPVQ